MFAIFLSLSLFLLACHSPGAQPGQGAILSKPRAKLLWRAGDPLPQYSWDKPQAYFELDEILEEISALAWLAEDRLLAVQDEDGLLFVLNARTGAIERQINFGPPGDYEGIAYTDTAIYILQAEGILYRLRDFVQGQGLRVDSFHLPFEAFNDFEGLEYEPEKERLLIVCKESGARLEDDFSYRAIYAWDIKTQQLSPLEPVWRLERPALLALADSLWAEEAPNDCLAKVHKRLPREHKKKKKDEAGEALAAPLPFKPSSLAIHPLTGHWYILSAVPCPSVLVYAPQTGQLLAWQALDEGLFPQPEGLCFSPQGKLYLSSEGLRKSQKGHLAVFEGL